MKLSKANIGQLFDIDGSDGSWVYQLVEVKKGELLFYNLAGGYFIDKASCSDWRPFKTQQQSKDRLKYGWSIGRRE